MRKLVGIGAVALGGRRGAAVRHGSRHRLVGCSEDCRPPGSRRRPAGSRFVARQEIVVVRGQTVQLRDNAVYWIYVAASANTLVWLWGGLGQLCLIGWGRRRFDGSWSPPSVRKDD